jgi:hypothetical protein
MLATSTYKSAQDQRSSSREGFDDLGNFASADFSRSLGDKSQHPDLKQAAESAFGFALGTSVAHDKTHRADLAVAGWSLAHGPSHLLIDGAFEGLPLSTRTPTPWRESRANAYSM